MRLRNVAWAIGVLLILLANASADSNGPAERSPADRALEAERVDQIPLSMADHNAIVTRILVITKDCAFRSNTRDIRRRNVNRLGFLQDLPYVGAAFGPTPRQKDFSPANQIGLVYLNEATLYVDLRPLGGTAAIDRAQLTALAEGPAGTASPPFALDSSMPPLSGLSVVNRDFQFLIPPAYFSAMSLPGKVCAKDALADLAPLGTLFDKPVGTVHLTNGLVNLLIRPSILATD